MELISDFNIDLSKRELITFVGAGGKTTTIFNLARELRDKGKKVLVTTTTAIYYPNDEKCDRIIVLDNEMENIFQEIFLGGITVVGQKVTDKGKLKGIECSIINELFLKKVFDYILVEGDGAKGKPIKVPADHEPVIPSLATLVIAVIGVDAVGRRINEDNVHRVLQFCEIAKKDISEIISEEDLVSISVNEKGIFKFAPKGSKKLLFLNKSRVPEDTEMLERIKKKIKIYNDEYGHGGNGWQHVNIDDIIIGIREEGKKNG